MVVTVLAGWLEAQVRLSTQLCTEALVAVDARGHRRGKTAHKRIVRGKPLERAILKPRAMIALEVQARRYLYPFANPRYLLARVHTTF
jgi:hypothetical protein